MPRSAQRQRLRAHRPRRPHQPRGEGGEGRPPLQLQRAGGGRRRQRAWSAPGYGKAGEVPEAIRKGIERARKIADRGAAQDGARCRTRCSAASAPARVLLRPASPGTGVIAGGARARGARGGRRARRADQDARHEQPASTWCARRSTALLELRDPDGSARRSCGSARGDAAKADMSTVRVKWVKSQIGFDRRQRATLRGLGFRRLNQARAGCRTRPPVRGMIRAGRAPRRGGGVG